MAVTRKALAKYGFSPEYFIIQNTATRLKLCRFWFLSKSTGRGKLYLKQTLTTENKDLTCAAIHGGDKKGAC
ncbi:hypothetical protein L21SP5_00955 [Salinivirga cyanobacteriivorans]|uniref:Uncharacterized protein n=1 Tax=Salinivirga cyanobacteriivorans TaxID=1307839 RepID=A0A0S2HX67_9BACT|nr:hypothetical protein L21SP5_00955 [Salinivirga cyanobacteriivorans]